jgi:hypothetical protein
VPDAVPKDKDRSAYHALRAEVEADVKARLAPPPGAASAPGLAALFASPDMLQLLVRGALDMAVDRFGGAAESAVGTARDTLRKWASDKVFEELQKIAGAARG